MKSRTQNSIINVVAAISGQGLSLIVSFVARIIFCMQLSSEFLGINSLFTNIVGLLSLAELGVGTAINYSLYKPLAERNIEMLKALMALYKKIYYIIGVFIFIIGIVLLPFLDFFLKTSDVNTIDNIYLIFVLFVVNSTVSYFYSYKRALIISDQKRYLATLYRYFFYILMNIIQIIVLLEYKNFILYLCVQLICTIAENITVSIKADKLYPFLKCKCSNPLTKDVLHDIKKNTIALLYHKIGSTVVNSTDNILISKMIGLATVGIYSNYLLITNALNIIMAQLFMAISASVGNMGATESASKSETVFYRVFFVNFIINCLICVNFYIFITPFVSMFFNSSMLLEDNVIVCIVINFFVYQIRRTVLTFRDAFGLFWYDRYKALVEAFFNLTISFWLGSLWGLSGIIIGTVVSSILTSIWIEPYVLYKYGFKTSPKKYFYKLILYSVLTGLLSYVCKTFVGTLESGDIFSLFFNILICSITVVITIYILFKNNDEMDFVLNLLNNFSQLLRRLKC